MMRGCDLGGMGEYAMRGFYGFQNVSSMFGVVVVRVKERGGRCAGGEDEHEEVVTPDMNVARHDERRTRINLHGRLKEV